MTKQENFMAMALEIELKLSLDKGDLPKVETLTILADYSSQAPVTRRLLSTYYDTADFLIRKNKMGLRIRQQAGQLIQTLKCSGQLIDGVHQRQELECEVSELTPQLDLIPDPQIKQTLLALVTTPLIPVFCTDFMRTSWQLHLPGGEAVEFALDVGEVRTSNKQTAFQEIELELITGEMSVLHDLAKSIAKEIPVVSQPMSKAGRGYLLL